MGRDDARVVPGLQGGTAPARAFAQFMRVAVAKRPVEQFETQVKLPEWQLEPDAEAYYGNTDPGQLVDENGNPIQPQARPYDGDQPPPDQSQISPDQGGVPPQGQEQLDDAFLDRALGRDRPPPRDPRVPPNVPRERVREPQPPDQARPYP